MSASNDPAGRTIDVPDVPMIGIYAEPNPVAREWQVLGASVAPQTLLRFDPAGQPLTS